MSEDGLDRDIRAEVEELAKDRAHARARNRALREARTVCGLIFAGAAGLTLDVWGFSWLAERTGYSGASGLAGFFVGAAIVMSVAITIAAATDAAATDFE